MAASRRYLIWGALILAVVAGAFALSLFPGKHGARYSEMFGRTVQMSPLVGSVRVGLCNAAESEYRAILAETDNAPAEFAAAARRDLSFEQASAILARRRKASGTLLEGNQATPKAALQAQRIAKKTDPHTNERENRMLSSDKAMRSALAYTLDNKTHALALYAEALRTMEQKFHEDMTKSTC